MGTAHNPNFNYLKQSLFLFVQEEIDDDDSDDLGERRRERGRLQSATSKRMTLINKKESHRSRKSMTSKFSGKRASYYQS